MSQLLHIKNFSLSINHSILIQNFSANIFPGDRIVLIGRNGSGKTTLLKTIANNLTQENRSIHAPEGLDIGFVPQQIPTEGSLSDGMKTIQCIRKTMKESVELLLLDEPTNYLDTEHRDMLKHLLIHYPGAIILVSHDEEFLNFFAEQIWEIEHSKINIFNGTYQEHLRFKKNNQETLISGLKSLKNQLIKTKQGAIKEQQRTSKSKRVNKKENDKNLLAKMKDTGSKTAGKNSSKINSIKIRTEEALAENFIRKEIQPNFLFKGKESEKNKFILSISDGSCGYQSPILSSISLHLDYGEKIHITGKNGSGKSTLLGAIMHLTNIRKEGDWYSPKLEDIGYFSSSWHFPDDTITVYEYIANQMPECSLAERRKHLNHYMFRSNREVEKPIKVLSGGERVRLAFCTIGARYPQLLILDEITNNLDIEMKKGVRKVINAFPGSVILVSHDSAFIETINIDRRYIIEDGRLK